METQAKLQASMDQQINCRIMGVSTPVSDLQCHLALPTNSQHNRNHKLWGNVYVNKFTVLMA